MRSTLSSFQAEMNSLKQRIDQHSMKLREVWEQFSVQGLKPSENDIKTTRSRVSELKNRLKSHSVLVNEKFDRVERSYKNSYELLGE